MGESEKGLSVYIICHEALRPFWLSPLDIFA